MENIGVLWPNRIARWEGVLSHRSLSSRLCRSCRWKIGKIYWFERLCVLPFTEQWDAVDNRLDEHRQRIEFKKRKNTNSINAPDVECKQLETSKSWSGKPISIGSGAGARWLLFHRKTTNNNNNNKFKRKKKQANEMHANVHTPTTNKQQVEDDSDDADAPFIFFSLPLSSWQIKEERI